MGYNFEHNGEIIWLSGHGKSKLFLSQVRYLECGLAFRPV